MIVTDSFNRANRPSNQARDYFDRVDGVLGNAETGQPWAILSGTWAVTSNLARYAGGAVSVQFAAVVDTGSADVTVRATMAAVSGGTGNAGICFRATDNANYWRLVADGAGTTLDRKVAGVFGGATTWPVARIKGELKVVCVGSTISAYRGGILLGSVVDAAHATATKHGLAYGVSNTDTGVPARWDDFAAGSAPVDGLGNADTGQPWVEQHGVWGIFSNQARERGSQGDAVHRYATVETLESDGIVTVTLPALEASTGNSGLVFRFVDRNNNWELESDGASGRSILLKHVAGVATVVGTLPIGRAAGDVLSAEFVGSTIRCFRNGTLIGTFVDPDHVAATKHGIYVSPVAGNLAGLSTTRFDDFSFGPSTAREVKVWDGSAWIAREVKVWDGSAWIAREVKVWDGSAWS